MTTPSEQASDKGTLPFHLRDNFAPTFEERTDTDLEVTGSIPPELNGRYFRNGPNPQSGWSPHWFLGNGMLHGVELGGGEAVWYRNRYVRTPLLENPDTDPMATIGDLRMSAANTNVIRHAGKILALEEAHLPFEVTPDLETVGPHDYAGKLTTPMTAHPKICPETGELLFFAYGVLPPYLTYHRASADGELVQSEEIPVKGATMVHDFAITRNHVVFMDLPVVWDLEGFDGSGLPLRWSNDYGARLGIMPRGGTPAELAWYEIDPCYVYHPMNAYEDDGGRIIVDVCRMTHTMKRGERETQPRLHRWTVDRTNGSVGETPLDDRASEFPRIHDDLVGKQYRYGYTAGMEERQTPRPVRFHKYDLQTGASVVHELAPGRVGGEPVFVPAADASAEDDGWVMAFVHDETVNRSELVVLDATRFDRDPVARIHLPTRVPAGFHGAWLADERSTS